MNRDAPQRPPPAFARPPSLPQRPLAPERRPQPEPGPGFAGRLHIYGNWKSHKGLSEARAFCEALPADATRGVELAIFPPFTALPLLAALRAERGWPLRLGAQCVSAWGEGAHTGEVTSEMVAELGAELTLIGHSERRREAGEDGPVTAAKVARARAAGLRPVLCIGETADERRSHRTDHILRRQLEDALGRADDGPLVVAYEPVWAIGSGQVPQAAELEDTAGALRRRLAELHPEGARPGRVPLLYGGSVARGNAAGLLAAGGFQGLLIGGASLDPRHLADIAAAAAARSLRP